MARKSKQAIDTEVLMEAKERLDMAFSADEDQRTLAVEDTRFAQIQGAQWEEVVGTGDNKRDRPRFEVNQISTLNNAVVGEWRQNRVQVKVRAANSEASNGLAETYNGLIKNIENTSNAKNAYDCAFESVVNGGFGAWRVKTDYEKDSFFQEIKICPIKNALTSVWVDPLATGDTKEDMEFGFILEEMSRKEYARKYPKSPISDFSTPQTFFAEHCGRFNVTQDTVRIGEYWRRIRVKKEIVQLSDGRVVSGEQLENIIDELAMSGIAPVKTRTVDAHKVEMFILSGLDVLAGPFEWPGETIPIVPVFGFNHYIDNKHYYHGNTRMGKDAQRVFNYALSANIEAVAQSPKDPYWMTRKQAEGMRRQFEVFNNENTPFMIYTHDDKNPGPPKRTGAPSVQNALVQSMGQAREDLRTALGRGIPMPNEAPGNESGRAIMARTRNGDMSTQILFDNVAEGVRRTGEIITEVIPKVYDTERQIRVIKPDDVTEFVPINSTVIDEQTGQPVIMNDMGAGKFDVMVDIGPSFASKRSEAVNALTTLAQSNPEFGQLSADLIAKNLDFAFSEELTERIRKRMLAEGLVKPTEDEAQELAQNAPQPDPVQEMMQQMQLKQMAANIDLTIAQQENTIASANNLIQAAEQKDAESAVMIERLKQELADMMLQGMKTMSEIENTDADTLNKHADTDKKLREATAIPSNGILATGEDLEARQDQLEIIEQKQSAITGPKFDQPL